MTIETADPGATASAVERTIAVPIEQQISGVEHLRQMRSRSRRGGSYTLLVSFAAGTDLNLAQVLVQNRVALALPALPAETQGLGVTIIKRSPDPLMLIALFSPDGRRDASYLANYATIQLKGDLAPLPGVAEVSIVGRQEFALRVRLDPDKLATRNLTLADVTQALKRQDGEAAAGQQAGPGGVPHHPPIDRGARMEPDQFAAIVIKTEPDGRAIRLRDVAGLELGAGPVGFESFAGRPAAVLVVYPLVHADRREVSAMVQARLLELGEQFPDGVDAFAGFDFSREPTGEAPGCLVLDVDPPVGASVEMIGRLLERGEQSLRRLAGVETVLVLAQQPFDRDRDQPCLVVCLGPANDAPVARERLSSAIRERLVAEQVGSIRVRELSGPARSRRLGYPLEFAIDGPDRARVQELAGQLVAQMLRDTRLTDVRAGSRPVPSLSVDIDQAKAASLGLAVADISASIQAARGAAQAGNITLAGRTWPVRVQVGSGGQPDVDAPIISSSAPRRARWCRCARSPLFAGKTSPAISSDSISVRLRRSPPALRGD